MKKTTASRTTAGTTRWAIGEGKMGTSPRPSDSFRPFQNDAGLLEDAFLPDRLTLVSFLVNAMYLIGDQAIAAYGGLPEGVEGELIRLGHKVTHGRYSGGGRDRALFLAQTFGLGGDAEITEALRTMRRTVRPGGLVCFHIFDRDRAWSQVGERTHTTRGVKSRVRVGFDPDSGRLTARAAQEAGPEGAYPGSGKSRAVKAWNLGEIKTLMRSVGLHLERAYGDWDGGSPETSGAETGRLILIASRPRSAR